MEQLRNPLPYLQRLKLIYRHFPHTVSKSSLLHCPFESRKTTAGNLAFPFSPSDLEGGPVYEFSVYHLLEADDSRSFFTPEFVTIGE